MVSCKCRNCGKPYNEAKARGDYKGYCSAKCQHHKAKELGYSLAKEKKGGLSEYQTLKNAGEIGSVHIDPVAHLKAKKAEAVQRPDPTAKTSGAPSAKNRQTAAPATKPSSAKETPTVHATEEGKQSLPFEERFPTLAAKAKEEAKRRGGAKPRTGTLPTSSKTESAPPSVLPAPTVSSPLSSPAAAAAKLAKLPARPSENTTSAPKLGVMAKLAEKKQVLATPVTIPSEVAGYVPTEEQRAILEAAADPTVRVLVTGAGAGTGKTSTLKMLEEVLPGNGQYTAFNASLVEESRGKFKKAKCNTTHSLAFGSVGRQFAHRLPKQGGGTRIRWSEVAVRLGIEPLTLMVPDIENGGLKSKTLAPSLLVGQVMHAIRRFCQSADRELECKHFKVLEGIDGTDPTTGQWEMTNQEIVRSYLLSFAQAAWADLSSPTGTLPFTHDYYVKVWQLGQGALTPVIYADYILLDEAQDTAPVFLDVLRRQTTRLILVGDDNQQIYEWRGAVNAMASFRDAPRRLLSQSFRFGQAIADVANSILATLETPTDLVMKGLSSIPSRVIERDARTGSPTGKVEHRAVLTRTNACAVGGLLRANASGKKGHLIGGGAEVVSFVKAAADLQANKPTAHPDLCCFSNWKEVQAYSKEDEGADLRLLVKLIDEFKVRPILDALERMPPEAEADIVFCTAHKSKGREWPSVRLGGDFPSANRMDDAARRLLYVAATRAQYVLDLSECPPFLWSKDKDTGEDIPPIKITYTAPMPPIEELTTYLQTKQEEVKAPTTPVVPYIPPETLPEWCWTKWEGRWVVRGPLTAQPVGSTVTLLKKNGTKQPVTLGIMLKQQSDHTLYQPR